MKVKERFFLKLFSLKIMLSFGFLGSLSTPSIVFGGIPLVFICPILFSIFISLILKFKFDRDMSYIVLVVFMVSLLSSVYPGIISNESISLPSSALYIVSLFVLIIYSSGFLVLLRQSNLENTGKLLIFLLSISVLEIVYPQIFLSIRESIYPDGMLMDFTERDNVYMMGTRPQLFFNEPSHVAKLLAIIWSIYAVKNRFSILSFIYFILIFIVLRSPTFFLVAPLLLFYLNMAKKGGVERVIFLGVIFSAGLFLISIIFLTRIDAVVQHGSGSFDERIFLPFRYLVTNWDYLSGFSIGSHQTMYNSICFAMAETRTWWDCSDNPSVASASIFMQIGLLGLFGIFLLLCLWVMKYGLFGLYIFMTYFVLQLFTTGYNTPGNFIIIGFVIALIIYKMRELNYLNRTKFLLFEKGKLISSV